MAFVALADDYSREEEVSDDAVTRELEYLVVTGSNVKFWQFLPSPGATQDPICLLQNGDRLWPIRLMTAVDNTKWWYCEIVTGIFDEARGYISADYVKVVHEGP